METSNISESTGSGATPDGRSFGDTGLPASTVAVKLGLDGFESVSDVAKQVEHFLPRGRLVACIVERLNVEVGAHDRAGAVARHYNALVSQSTNGAPGGSDGYAVLRRERFVARQGGARGIPALSDCVQERGSDLLIRRAGVADVGLSHAEHGTGDSPNILSLPSMLTDLTDVPNVACVADLAAASLNSKNAPTGAATPAGAHIETLGATMQVDRTRLYRVQAVAKAFDVSVATIYRAVESGSLRAIRLGTGKGAVRIPGDALEDYLASCEAAAATRVRQSGENHGDVRVAGGAA